MPHEIFMQRALDLAERGTGCTSPNPLVGCVVVVNDTIIGEGWHERYGHHHAEVNAINAARKHFAAAQQQTEGAFLKDHQATLYVTLEPCHHYGLTPPCTKAIVEAGVSHVVYAMADPNPKAAGGDQWLASHGVELTRGILEAEAAYQNRFFFNFVATGRPYVIAKSATSLDGRIATRSGHSQWITGPESRLRAHHLRQSTDAILVGADTVIADNPSLTVRLPEDLFPPELVKHPRPVVLDTDGRIPLSSHLLDGSLPTKTLVLTSHDVADSHRNALEANGNDVIAIAKNTSGKGLCPNAIVNVLGEIGIQSVLLEGGAQVQGTFRDADCIDEVWTFIAPTIIGGSEALSSYQATGSQTLDDASKLEHVEIEHLGRDLLVRGLVTKSRQQANANSINTISGKSTSSVNPDLDTRETV